jgi:type IX secretion system PorP/SprF family membrane protein
MRRISTGAVIIASIIIGSLHSAKAQQAAMYSQYMFNALAVNPAYAGSRNVLSATALYRTQWVGVAGAPRTATLTMDAPVERKSLGIGFQLFSDKLGITESTGAVLSLAYRLRLDQATLSFGMQGNVNQYRASYSQVNLLPTGGPGDDPAFANDIDRVLLNTGAGIYYNSDRFYFGVSVPEMLRNKLTTQSSSSNSERARQALHLFVSTGFVMPLGSDFMLKPSFLLKAVEGSPIEGDINGTLWIKDRFAIGAQYRTSADVSGMFEMQIAPQVRIGYCYDHSLTNLSSYGSGSHEIMLRYEFGYQAEKVLSPRYF